MGIGARVRTAQDPLEANRVLELDPHRSSLRTRCTIRRGPYHPLYRRIHGRLGPNVTFTRWRKRVPTRCVRCGIDPRIPGITSRVGYQRRHHATTSGSQWRHNKAIPNKEKGVSPIHQATRDVPGVHTKKRRVRITNPHTRDAIWNHIDIPGSHVLIAPIPRYEMATNYTACAHLSTVFLTRSKIMDPPSRLGIASSYEPQLLHGGT
jgi:hypothetical protein